MGNIRQLRILMLCFGAFLFQTPVLWAQNEDDETEPGAAAPEDPEIDALRRMLEVAWSKDKQAPQFTKQLYESLRPQIRDQRRWHYAYGVASLKLKRYPAAVQAFQSAKQGDGEFQFAPWKGLLWTEFTLKRYDDGLDHLKSLAQIIGSEEFSGTSEDQVRVAGWIGQTLAALEITVAAPKTQTRLLEIDRELKELWPEELRAACQEGRDFTKLQYEDLLSDVKQAGEDAEFRQELARKDQQQALKKDIADADKQREELKKSAQVVQQLAEQKAKEIEKQITRLENDYGLLEARAKVLMQSITLLSAQLQQAQQQRQNSGQQNSSVTNETLQRLEFQLGMYQQEYDTTLLRANHVAQRAMLGLQLRQQTLQQAQLATGDLNRQDASLGKWQNRLANAGEKLKSGKIKDSAKTIRQKKQKAKELETYLEFDPEWERIRLTDPSGAA